MKKILFIFALVILISGIVPVYAQDTNPYIDFLKKYINATGHGTNCPDGKKDKNGNCNPACCKTNDDCKANGPDQTCEIQNGECGSGTSCLDPHDPTQACVAEGKKDKYGNYNPACCSSDTDCPGDQTCTIGNNFCKSGNSCDPNGHRSTTTQPSTPSNGGSTTTPPNSNPPTGLYKTRLDNFTYYCQGDNRWRDIHGLDQAGCGPSSTAMVISHFGILMSPPQVDAIYQQNKWRVNPDDGSMEIAAITSPWFKNQLGFTVGEELVHNGALDINLAKTYLQQGYLIIGSSDDFPCGGGCTDTYANHSLKHIVVIDYIDNNGRVRVRDPSNCVWGRQAANNGEEVLEDRFLYRPAYQISKYAYPVKLTK